jgi:thioredoxin reductase (NADPH)
LAAACAAAETGLRYVVVERCGPVQSLVEHPQQIQYFSPADEMAIGGVPFFMAGGHKPTREDALAYYRAVATSKRLNLATWEEVTDVSQHGDIFRVRSVRREADAGMVVERSARYLLVCTGTFPNPRRLDTVPGGDLPKVRYRLEDPTPYFGRNVLVIGGGNSAATAAMTLAEAGAKVTVVMRRPPIPFQNHLRPFIVRDLLIHHDEKRLNLLAGLCLTRITPTEIELSPWCNSGADAATLPNDFVFAMLGHTADPVLFAHLGVSLAEDGLPVYDEATAETPVPGLFVAGALSRANIIVESRRRAVEIVALIRERLSASAAADHPAHPVPGYPRG